MQEVPLHDLWNIVPKENYGGPKLGQCNLVFRFSRMNVHGDLHPEDDCIQHGAHPLLVGLTIFQ
jgi:hypothetical protein